MSIVTAVKKPLVDLFVAALEITLSPTGACIAAVINIFLMLMFPGFGRTEQ